MLPAGEYTFGTDGKLVKDGLGITSLSVKAAQSSQDDKLGSVNWYALNNENYLFLPSCVQEDNLSITMTTANSGMVNCSDKKIVSGEATDVFADRDSVTLTCNDKSYNVTEMKGSLPAVFINTDSGSLANVHSDKEYKDSGKILIVDEIGTVQYDGELDYLKGRGETTWNGEKKPYNIKLAKKADLFGMGDAKKWSLLANGADSSLIRNPLSYKMSQLLGNDTTSDTQLIDLYINGNYAGVYLLTEKVEIGKNRVDINDLEAATEKVNDKDLEKYPLAGDQDSEKPNTYQYVDIPNNPEDITGGYLMELEKSMRYPREASGFVSARNQFVVLKSPEYATKEQVEYIRGYYQEMEDALYSGTGYNSLGKYYTEYIDVDSFARTYIVQEFAENFDGCNSSFFIYKDIDGKLTAGPAWDFDIGYAESPSLNTQLNNVTNKGDPNSLYIQHCYIQDVCPNHFSFLAQLFSHNDFQELVQKIWNEEFGSVYNTLQDFIDSVAEEAHESVVLNSYRWGTFGRGSSDDIIAAYERKADFMRSYVVQRYDYLSYAYSESTYFVKYDVGDSGKTLVHDTNVYTSGQSATVKAGPICIDKTKVFDCWTTNPDGSGQRYVKGDVITVTGNTNLFAQWKDK